MTRIRTACLVIFTTVLLGGSSRPGALRNDAGFWNMLTARGRTVVMNVTVFSAPICSGTIHGTFFTGARYDWVENTITLCGVDILAEPNILRHEFLHALDRAGKVPSAEAGFADVVSAKLYAAAEEVYPGWFRPPELYATLPLIVNWHFDQLPPEVAAYYTPYFE